jgi:ribonuclease P protein component
LIVALGRTAGDAVTRSRVRRVAREVFRPLRDVKPRIDVLVLAREEVKKVPRRDLRNALQGLMARGADAIRQRQLSKGRVGV